MSDALVIKPTRMNRRVLTALLDAPAENHFLVALAKTARVNGGAMYTLIKQMEIRGWLYSHWETDAEAKGRPRRKYYRLTELGVREARALLATREAH